MGEECGQEATGRAEGWEAFLAWHKFDSLSGASLSSRANNGAGHACSPSRPPLKAADAKHLVTAGFYGAAA